MRVSWKEAGEGVSEVTRNGIVQQYVTLAGVHGGPRVEAIVYDPSRKLIAVLPLTRLTVIEPEWPKPAPRNCTAACLSRGCNCGGHSAAGKEQDESSCVVEGKGGAHSIHGVTMPLNTKLFCYGPQRREVLEELNALIPLPVVVGLDCANLEAVRGINCGVFINLITHGQQPPAELLVQLHAQGFCMLTIDDTWVQARARYTGHKT